MSLTPGSRLGPYEVTALLGEGGMGQVYRATDTNLKRQVALKVLPDSVAGDAERLARFQREAEVLAALNHPNIAAIHGLEKTPDFTALVMELVQGDDLSQRIARGAIPLDEALPIAKQIAEALEAAHEQGIIHRDLKPANIKVRADGTVKVLDFGLAKALDPAAASSPDAMNSPTITSPAMTQAGMILGTAAYMAPEQAKGKAVDRRADIWAFGVVLYEMVTGRRAFEGDEISDVLAAVLRHDIDFNALPPSTPSRLRALLARCLDRDLKTRLRDIGEARIAIDKITAGAPDDAVATAATGATAVAPTAPFWRRALPWAIASVAVIVAGLLLTLWAPWRSAPVPAPMRLDITTPPTRDPLSFALSPDGKSVVFVAETDGRPRLWLRSLDSSSARPLDRTEGASYPFWSPENRSVGFFSDDGKLKRIDLAGNRVQTLADAPVGRGGAWNSDGVILFTPDTTGAGIWRIPAGGGDPVAATKRGGGNQRFPYFLADGRHFLFIGLGQPQNTIYVGSLDGLETKRLLDADSTPVFLPSGYLLFVRQGALLAQRFDPIRLELSGDAFPVQEDRASGSGLSVGTTGGAALSASSTGLFAYRDTETARPTSTQFIWYDRSGKQTGAVDNLNGPSDPELSPDGHRLLIRQQNENWLLEIARGAMGRLMSGFILTAWSADGSRVAFARSQRQNSPGFYEKPVSGLSTEKLIANIQAPGEHLLQDWSRDGRFLLYTRNTGTETSRQDDLWALQLGGQHEPFPVAQTKFEERHGQFSPDGKWVAYASNESNTYQVFVQSFPTPSTRSQVSVTGGGQPRWSGNGKELFYIDPQRKMIAVPLRTTDGKTIEPGSPVTLFSTQIAWGMMPDVRYRQQYAVSPDGQKFIINTEGDVPSSSPLTIVLNWKPPTK